MNTSIKCPNCGGIIIIDSNYEYICPYCGSKFGYAPDPQKQQLAEKNKIRGKVYSGLAITFFILGLFGVFSSTVEGVYTAYILFLCSLIAGIVAVARYKKKLSIIPITVCTAFLVFMTINMGFGFSEGISKNAEQYESPYLIYNESLQHSENFIMPSEEFCKKALNNTEGVIDITAVTDYHDPNGGLSREDGYTSCLVFSYEGIDLEQIDGYDLIDKGICVGGYIEIYRTEEDAQKRLDSFAKVRKIGVGGCGRVGTIIIRTSPMLSSKDQQVLFENIVQAIDS